MEREKIIKEAKAELERHIWGTFVEGKASVALGGTGVANGKCRRIKVTLRLTVCHACNKGSSAARQWDARKRLNALSECNFLN